MFVSCFEILVTVVKSLGSLTGDEMWCEMIERGGDVWV